MRRLCNNSNPGERPRRNISGQCEEAGWRPKTDPREMGRPERSPLFTTNTGRSREPFCLSDAQTGKRPVPPQTARVLCATRATWRTAQTRPVRAPPYSRPGCGAGPASLCQQTHFRDSQRKSTNTSSPRHPQTDGLRKEHDDCLESCAARN